MKILAIETSCDETSASVVSKNPNESEVKILSNTIASSLDLHSITGGVIPNVAAREQLKHIIPVIQTALDDSKENIVNLDAIAVTIGPGLIGSLLIGVETAKTLSYLWNKPIIPVNHLLGHIYANFIGSSDKKLQKISFPAMVLLVSGGHTDLVYMKDHGKIKWIGGTLDDAAGEAFDKIGRLLNLPYPAGPIMENLAKKGNENYYKFPRPMIGSKDYSFSFSGLKAALAREIKKIFPTMNHEQSTISNVCASVQKSIVEVLVRKTLKAAKKYNVKTILLAGGVASNQKLRDEFELNAKRYFLNAKIFSPEKNLCTDNAAMIGAYACFNPEKSTWKKVSANPELYF